MIEAAGFKPTYYHVANTAAIASCGEAWNNMVRPGISPYGYHLRFVCGRTSCPILVPNVDPVLSWKTRVISLREVGTNQSIGYDGAYVTSAPARLAALPVGYGDGLSRQLSSRGRVIIHDTYARIVGNIAMDITVIDVTPVADVKLGDQVILLGSSNDRSVSAWEHADLENTIPYEVLCRVGRSVPREYLV